MIVPFQSAKAFSLKLALFAFLALSITTVGAGNAAWAAEAKAAFPDIGQSYAQNEITALVQAGILSGYEDGSFKPTQSMTRADLAKVLVLTLGLKEEPEAAAHFTDVPLDAWYRGYVGALVKAGISQGTAGDLFFPEGSVTREQLAVFFIRALGLEKEAAQLKPDAKLADIDGVSDWAKPYVALAFKIGFIQGQTDEKGDIRFHPEEPAQRQALARLAYNFKFERGNYIDQAGRFVEEQSEKPFSNIGTKPGAGYSTKSPVTGSSPKGREPSNDPPGPRVETPASPAPPPVAVGGGGAGTPPQTGMKENVGSITAVDTVTVSITFDRAPSNVNAADYGFDGSLIVTGAVIQEGGLTVHLTTTPQKKGQSYTLFYKGQSTGKSIVGPSPIRDIQAAVKAIGVLPAKTALTLTDKPAVLQARQKVSSAMALGAGQDDIGNFAVLVQAEARIQELETEMVLPLKVLSASANIGGHTIQASVQDNIVSISLPVELGEQDKFTGFQVTATERAKTLTVSSFGITRSISFSEGSAYVSVSQLLGSLDKQGDGITVAMIRLLTGGGTISVTGEMTDESGRSTAITIRLGM